MLANMILEESANVRVQSDMHFTRSLNKEQQFAYDTISDCVFNDRNRLFFIDGPGGTSKIYLYEALLATVRCRQLIALTTASSGVAASLLPIGEFVIRVLKFIFKQVLICDVR